MSFEQPLEEHEDPHPSAYDVMPDGKTRAYHVESIVNERNKKRGNHQYLVRYKDGQYQWWKRSDVQSYLSIFLKQYNEQKSVNGNTPRPGKLDKIHVKRKGDLSFKITTPPPTEKDDKERSLSLRFCTRSGSQNAENNGPVSKSTVRIDRDTQGAVLISSGESSNGNSDHCPLKKQRLSLKINESMVASTSLKMNASNDGGENGVSHAKNTEDIHKLPAIKGNTTIQEISNGKTGLDLAEKSLFQVLKEDPYNTIGLLAKAMKEVQEGCVGPTLKAREDDREEKEKMKLKYKEAATEIKKLKDKVKEVEREKIARCQEYEKWLKEKETDHSKTKEELDKVLLEVANNQKREAQNKMEMEKQLKDKDAQHLDTLREIVGEKNNKKDTDDIAALKKTAIKRSKWLDYYLSAHSFGDSDNEAADITKRDSS